MTAVRRAGAAGDRLPAGQLPRLVAAGAPLGLQAHLSRYGPLPLTGPAGAASPAGLIAQVERAGLTGRGGAAFPTARKMRAVAGAGRRGRRRGGAVLIANGAEVRAREREGLHPAPPVPASGARRDRAGRGRGRRGHRLPVRRRH